jgi:3-oxosteroid 1-dehydrogenase
MTGSSAVPAAPADSQYDVIVVGAGAAGLTTANVAAREGASVLVLEAAGSVGGTSAKSGGGYWIPANRYMAERGFTEDRAMCLSHMALLAFPGRYQRDADRHGLEKHEWEHLTNYFDHAAEIIDDLEQRGILPSTMMESFRGDRNGIAPWFVTEADPGTYGRVLAPRRAADLPSRDSLSVFSASDGAAHPGTAAMRARGATQGDGQDLVRHLLAATEQTEGIEIVVGFRVTDVIADGGRVRGVVARSAGGELRLAASQGVVFCSGGFEHNQELRERYLRGPLVGSCGAATNRGDFVPIAQRLGATLDNMSEGWWSELPLEPCLDSFEQGVLMSTPFGDSMILVNRQGERVVNEKLMYNERGKIHFAKDDSGGYPNYLLFQIFDNPVLRFEGPWPSRWPVPYPEDERPSYLLSGETFAELAASIRERLAQLAGAIAGFQVTEDFAARLEATVGRFNAFARAGRDDDFRRGETITETYFAADLRENPAPNHTMHPFTDSGPYYAVILGASALGTKGGPRVDTSARVLGEDGSPIPGLFAAGNCMGSPSGESYWGGGATLGMALTFAHIAARSAVGRAPTPAVIAPARAEAGQ